MEEEQARSHRGAVRMEGMGMTEQEREELIEKMVLRMERLREENARLREAHEKIGYDFSLNRDEAAIVARVAICKGGNDAK